MFVNQKYEKKRVNIQAAIDAQKSQADRNRMGQFATPTNLAQEILLHTKSLLPLHLKVRFLDPAFGTGSFYSAFLRIFPHSRIIEAVGFEIDPIYGEAAQRIWANTPLRLYINDFTKAKAPESEKEKFNLIICNPPYVRHHHIVNGEKKRLQCIIEKLCGIHISGLAGLYCYFLCFSHSWMNSKGLACWLIPSEFMDVNYGKAIKNYLLNKVTLIQIHRFDPNDVQFEDALVSSAIVWFRNEKPKVGHEILFTYGGTLALPHIKKYIPIDVLREESKWTRFPICEVQQLRHGSTLKDFFLIKRGVATGDNSFFILNQEQIKIRNLPYNFLRPILPSPRFLKLEIIEEDSKGIPIIDKPLFLLDCHFMESEIKLKYPALYQYLQEGKTKGVPNRYLCRHRIPWYSQENRQVPLFVFTYIGRSDQQGKRPFRFILNRSKAIVTNSYLALYPKAPLVRVLQKNSNMALQILRILNKISPISLLEKGRVYGGGLHKLEPKELENVQADELMILLKDVVKIPYQMNLFEVKEANESLNPTSLSWS